VCRPSIASSHQPSLWRGPSTFFKCFFQWCGTRSIAHHATGVTNACILLAKPPVRGGLVPGSLAARLPASPASSPPHRPSARPPAPLAPSPTCRFDDGRPGTHSLPCTAAHLTHVPVLLTSRSLMRGPLRTITSTPAPKVFLRASCSRTRWTRDPTPAPPAEQPPDSPCLVLPSTPRAHHPASSRTPGVAHRGDVHNPLLDHPDVAPKRRDGPPEVSLRTSCASSQSGCWPFLLVAERSGPSPAAPRERPTLRPLSGRPRHESWSYNRADPARTPRTPLPGHHTHRAPLVAARRAGECSPGRFLSLARTSGRGCVRRRCGR